MVTHPSYNNALRERQEGRTVWGKLCLRTEFQAHEDYGVSPVSKNNTTTISSTLKPKKKERMLWLRECTVLAQYLHPVPNTCIGKLTAASNCSSRAWDSFLAFMCTHLHHIYMHRELYIKVNLFFLMAVDYFKTRRKSYWVAFLVLSVPLQFDQSLGLWLSLW